MVKIFRKVRQNLLRENRVGKYLIYAIGEIILIVIGIMIAIQLNNWNENRKAKNKEIKVLKELRADLVQHLSDFEMNIHNLEAWKNSNEIILYCMDNNIPYNDTLDNHFINLYRYFTFTINETTYNTLKQTGMDLISNDTLRKSISDLYANQFSHFRHLVDTYMIEHYNNYLKPLYMDAFLTYDYPTSAKPKNYDQFIRHPKYKQVINFNIVICNNFLRIYQSRLKPNVEGLISAIDMEISN
jgi:hypothetical protein